MAASVIYSKSKLTKVVLLSAGLISYVPASSAQQAASKRRPAIKPPVVLISPAQPSADVLPAPRTLTPEEMPPVVPQISWDGEQLAISAENSTLASVLEAVKQTLGTDIDVPSGAARERIVVHLGPGPAREVLSSLLTGTSFDYIIQAADDNPLGVQSILLTPRSKPGSTGSNDIRSAILASEPRRRFAPSVPPPPDPTAAVESSSNVQPPAAAQQTAADSSVTATGAASTNGQGSPIVATAPASTADPNPATQPSAATADAKQTNTDAPNTDNGAVAIQADLTPAAAPADSANKPPVSMRDQKVLEMENLFEQRKRMQEQALKGSQSN